MLFKFFNENEYQIRLYLLRGISLSAVDNTPDLPAWAAGLKALSSCNSYPEIIVGEGSKSKGNYINEQNLPEKSTMHPEFFRTYTFNAKFPSDWCLKIRMYDFA